MTNRLHLVIPSGTIFDKEMNLHIGAEKFLKNCISIGYDCIFMTHDSGKVSKYSKILTELIGKSVEFHSRKRVREVFKQEQVKNMLNTTIVIGSSEADFHLASNFKLLYLYPIWNINSGDERASIYGFKVEDFDSLLEYLEIVRNQTEFYYKLNIDSKTTLYALTSANNNIASPLESDMIDDFRAVLKNGNREYFEPLFFHMISSVMKDEMLRQIGIWSVMPSSTLKINEDMNEIKKRCRFLTSNRRKDPLFIRYKEVPKSRETSHKDRLMAGATKHLNSIHVNPEYRTKIEGMTVCVIDDYVTNGSSFEAIRNLLLEAGAERIIFFAFGRFKKGSMGIYQKEDYKITGDIFSPDFKFELLEKNEYFGNNGKYNLQAKTEVENIRKIINSDGIGINNNSKK